MSQPITDEQRAEVIRLHSQGMARNEIARQVGIGAATVSRVVHAAGGNFDRTETRAATAARQVDLAAMRAELQQGLLEDAAKLRSQIFAPTIVYNFGGKDNTYEERYVDQPPSLDKLKLMQAATTAITTSLRLSEHDSPTAAKVKGLLGDLAQQLVAGDA